MATSSIAAAVLLVVAVGGWRVYEWWETKKAAEAGTAFEAAMTLSEQGKTAEAEAAFAKIAADGTASYRMLWPSCARPAELAQRDPKAAVATLRCARRRHERRPGAAGPRGAARRA